MKLKHLSPNQPFVAALAWTLVPALAAILVAQCLTDIELRKVLYVGAGTLIFGGFLGGMLKVFIDEIVAAKRRREEIVQFVANVLSDLKRVYDSVARARILIPAHKSVKTYGEEMRAMIEARVQLRNVTRALERQAEGMDDKTRQAVANHVNSMEKYLETLTSEFRDHFKPLSDKQRGYEDRAQVMLKAFADDPKAVEPPDLPDFVWMSLTGLRNLSDFIGEGESYRTQFERPLDDASAILRIELARSLSSASVVSVASGDQPSRRS